MKKSLTSNVSPQQEEKLFYQYSLFNLAVRLFQFSAANFLSFFIFRSLICASVRQPIHSLYHYASRHLSTSSFPRNSNENLFRFIVFSNPWCWFPASLCYVLQHSLHSSPRPSKFWDFLSQCESLKIAEHTLPYNMFSEVPPPTPPRLLTFSPE